MSQNWTFSLLRLLRVKRELQRVDYRHRYPLTVPGYPAREDDLTEAERVLGGRLDTQYRAFLRQADGWPGFYGRVNLFGTADLLGSPDQQHAHHLLDALEEDGALAQARVQREDVLPIAVSPRDIDLFVLLRPEAPTPGAVIWFAGDEIERYDDFSGFYDAMIDANQDLITLLTFSQRHALLDDQQMAQMYGI